MSLARRERMAIDWLPPEGPAAPMPVVPSSAARRARQLGQGLNWGARPQDQGTALATEAALSALVDTMRQGPTRSRRQNIIPGAS